MNCRDLEKLISLATVMLLDVNNPKTPFLNLRQHKVSDECPDFVVLNVV